MEHCKLVCGSECAKRMDLTFFSTKKKTILICKEEGLCDILAKIWGTVIRVSASCLRDPDPPHYSGAFGQLCQEEQ